MQIQSLFSILNEGWVWWDKKSFCWKFCPFEPVWNSYLKCFDVKTLEESVDISNSFKSDIDPPENKDEYIVLKIVHSSDTTNININHK